MWLRRVFFISNHRSMMVRRTLCRRRRCGLLCRRCRSSGRGCLGAARSAPREARSGRNCRFPTAYSSRSRDRSGHSVDIGFVCQRQNVVRVDKDTRGGGKLTYRRPPRVFRRAPRISAGDTEIHSGQLRPPRAPRHPPRPPRSHPCRTCLSLCFHFLLLPHSRTGGASRTRFER